MKKLFKFLVGPVEVLCWFRWKQFFELFSVTWIDGITVTVLNLSVDVKKRDEEF
jgi:hypothetical protein